MDPVRRQYETYPYPERDPADEAKRLIEGSPSHPVEIDHFLYGGRRDWSQPFRALVAGGGTGDGLIMLAVKLADIGCPAEITYLDMSEASRAVAEARAAARGLGSIRFVTGDLLTAPEYGAFDYIDCCGVLHHLADPDAGFRALAEALAPGGGIGLMVYAPHGRTGVYPLQAAFGRLFAGDPPEDQVRLARHVLGGLPETNWFGAMSCWATTAHRMPGSTTCCCTAATGPIRWRSLTGRWSGRGWGWFLSLSRRATIRSTTCRAIQTWRSGSRRWNRWRKPPWRNSSRAT